MEASIQFWFTTKDDDTLPAKLQVMRTHVHLIILWCLTKLS